MPRMAAADDLLERVLVSLAKRMSGSVGAVTAFLLYGGLGLALPLLAHWSVSWLVAANVTATMLDSLLIIVWLVVQVQAAHAPASRKRHEVRPRAGRVHRSAPSTDPYEDQVRLRNAARGTASGWSLATSIYVGP